MGFIRTFSAIFTPSQRRYYAALQAYFLLAALVQVAGVASVAPFIALLANTRLIHSNPVANALYVAGGFTGEQTFLVAFAVALMLLIIASNVVLAGVTWVTTSFSLRLNIELQRDIYRGYLHRPYAIVSRTNSSHLVSVLMQDAARFIFMVVQPVLNLTSQIMVVLLIVGGLVWYNVVVACFAFAVVGGGYMLMYRSGRRLLETHGLVIWDTNRQKLRLLTESLGGIKEIKLAGIEAQYERKLESVSTAGMHSGNVIGLVGDLPKFILEPTTFCALLGLGIYLILSGDNASRIVGTLSLYAVSGYKLLPAAQNIFKSLSQIRANAGVMVELGPEIRAGRAASAESVELPTTRLDGEIAFQSVSYRYPEAGTLALEQASFVIPRDAMTVLVGPSGSGKSTLADLLLGLLEPTEGAILVGGRSITKALPSWQRGLGYVPQNIFLLDDTIAANISFGSPYPQDMAKVRRAASLADLAEFIESLPEQYGYVVGERGGLLSGGQRQRLGIARALYHTASVLVLDEATSALDAASERSILTTLASLKQHTTIVMIAHRVATINAADQVIMVHCGRIQAVGSPDDLRVTSASFRDAVRAGNDAVRGAEYA